MTFKLGDYIVVYVEYPSSNKPIIAGTYKEGSVVYSYVETFLDILSKNDKHAFILNDIDKNILTYLYASMNLPYGKDTIIRRLITACLDKSSTILIQNFW